MNHGQMRDSEISGYDQRIKAHKKTNVNANDSKRKLFYAFRPHEDDENAHRKHINSKTLSKVDKFENAVYASSCGRP